MVSLTRYQVQMHDRLAIEDLKIPGVVLMENAGRNVAEQVVGLMADQLKAGAAKVRVGVVCGGGNNGGDGYVAARHLHNRGLEVGVFAVVDPDFLTDDAAVHYEICRRMELPIACVRSGAELQEQWRSWGRADVLLDAVLGTGFSGKLRPQTAEVIRVCNGLSGPMVVAVDVPSGLDCNTGEPSDPTIRADVTVTFVAEKAGFSSESAKRFLGRVVVADIGTPPELLERVLTMGGNEVAR